MQAQFRGGLQAQFHGEPALCEFDEATERVRARLEQNGRQLADISRNGDCQFASIADQLTALGMPKSKEQVRREV